MKRGILFLIISMLILICPLTVDAASGDVKIKQNGTYTLTSDLTVQGDLYVQSEMDFNGYSVYVKGNVYADANVLMGDGNLTVDGSYWQRKDALKYGNGDIIIHGDFKIYEVDSKGKIVPANASVWMNGNTDMATAVIDGDIIVCNKPMMSMGSVTVKGDVDIESGGWIAGLTMAGNGLQKLHTTEYLLIEALNPVNPKIELGEALSAYFVADATELTMTGDTLYSGLLVAEGCDVVIPGNVIMAHLPGSYPGSLYVRDGGDLTIQGDLINKSGNIDCRDGELYVQGDLRMQSIDEKGNYITGSSSILYYGHNIRVGNDFIIDPTGEIDDTIIIVGGDIKQISGNAITLDYVILTPGDKHNITLKSGSVINTLELTDDKADCKFSPANCWNEIIQLEGLVKFPEGYKLFEDGYWIKDAYKYVNYDGGKFLVAHGMLATHISGLAKDPNTTNDWYYLANGQAQTQYTGFASYDGEWFYVTKGKLDTGVNGYLKYNGGLFYIGAGRVMSEVNGLAEDPKTGKWYYVAGGQVQTQHTGLSEYDGEWFYVVNGVLAEDYTGKVKYDGKYFNVIKGMVKG